MENKHYSRKQRQLKYLVKQLNNLLKKADDNLKSEIKKIAAKIKYLVSQLNGIVSTNRMKRILGGIALLIGISFANTASAQYFAYPTTNPFGITPGYTNYLQSVNLIDIDNDGDFDLFTDSLTYSGYYSLSRNFNYQENIGTATNPNFQTPQLNPFNLSLIPNDTSMINLRHFVDLDDDGDFDVLSNVLYQGYSQGYYSFMSKYRYYENTGTPSTPNFASAVTNPFGLQDSPNIEFSAIGDIDNDGDFDLINSSLSYSSQTTSFTFIENTGTNFNPIFTTPQTNNFGLPPSLGIKNPELTDLDSDGDLDIIFGEESYYSGQFRYHENTGTINSAQFATSVINPYGLNGSIFDNMPTFEFKDLDNDSDLDLLAGTAEETFYFENVGVQQPVTYECINYSCVDPGTGNGTYATLSACQTSCILPVTYNCDWSGTCWDPLDGTGTYTNLNDCQTNCIVPVTYECDWATGSCYDPGNGWGGFLDSMNCVMQCQIPETWNCISPGDCQDPGDGSGQYWAYNACITGCPIPETYDCDVVTGCYDPGTGQGLYTSLAGCQANCTSTSIENTEINNLKLYPNPVNNTLNISSNKKIKKIEIYDALGRVIYTENNPSSAINVEQLEAGLYSIAIIFDDNRIVKKFTK